MKKGRSSLFGKTALLFAAASLVFPACSALGSPSNQHTVAFIPNYQQGGGASPTPMPLGYATHRAPVTVSLGETDPSHMFIHLSQPFAPAGKTSFLVTNQGTEKHEFVVLATKTPAADFPIVSFEGEANRIDEDAKGVTNVGETGDMAPGTSKLLTIDLPAGHYAVVCNLPGHYANGMHQDFWVTPSGSIL